MRRPTISLGSDHGETLVEVLVAVAILGLAGVAVVAGLQMSVSASDIHRKDTSGGAYVRDWAEAIEKSVASGNYKDCAQPSDYLPDKVGYVLPSGFAPTQTSALRVPPGPDPVDPSASPPAVPSTAPFVTSCSGNDTGIQQVGLTVASADGRAKEQLTVILRRPCSASQTVCS